MARAGVSVPGFTPVSHGLRKGEKIIPWMKESGVEQERIDLHAYRKVRY